LYLAPLFLKAFLRKNKYVELEINNIRKEFPVLSREVYNKPIVYLDNAATTQKPRCVIDRLRDYYEAENSNIHRGVHFMSQEATSAFEHARENVRAFINANSLSEIIFTKGTTESINLVANSFGKAFLRSDDEIVISQMEHHSNLVPWQIACEEHGAILKVADITTSGEINIEALKKLLSDKTRLVAITHVSNTLGTVNPVTEIVRLAHSFGAYVLIDGAQAVAHHTVDVQEMNCDFYCFSGHKMYGPMGIGVLYGKERLLDQMPPYQGGGEMVSQVTFNKTTYNNLPFKFEAGTPNVAGVLGLEKAIGFMINLGMKNIAGYENQVLSYAMKKIGEIDSVTIYGQAAQKSGIVSFNLKGVHPFDAGTIIDKFGVAVRTGHLCTQPLIQFYNVPGFIRASFAIYNTTEEVDKLSEAIVKAREMLT